MPDQILFSDIDLSFTKNPATGDLYKLTNSDAVARSFKNLLSENFYERLMQPEIGTQIYAMLFENATSDIETFLEDLVKHTIENFESRVVLQDVNITTNNHSLNITISYKIVGYQKVYTAAVFLQKTK